MFKSSIPENSLQGFYIRPNKLYSVLVLYKAVIGGVLEPLGRGKGRRRSFCRLDRF